ncbi:hypothetical protein DE146DRAFT_476239 [Phaeosphaeria sp. MPI-PUGE-AT-0046c]|nr:hypothetical protein DE146DRAFT_476239 [Phaeosphaeria sp. MPI-PUGE-AT-0046c]
MFQGFQRIRGAIDARIAEEQAKQQPSRSNSTARRSSSRNLSPSKRTARSKDGDNSKTAPTGKGPDPSEFDPEFVIGDEDEQPSRVGTPRPKEKAPTAEGAVENDGEKDDGKVAEAQEKPDKAPEIPPEVQVRLRKLDKLEPKYTELLRSYRIAHARIGAIETFESSLREHTPLTSITDTAAFIEYLGQLNVKSDMLMEELKRVSKERDDINKKLEDAEKRAKQANEEVEALNAKAASVADAATADTTAPTASTGPSTSNASKEAATAGDDEEFFSYDSELPRLQTQLQESEAKVGKLEEENTSLKGELAVAQESAESFMKNLNYAMHTQRPKSEATL